MLLLFKRSSKQESSLVHSPETGKSETLEGHLVVDEPRLVAHPIFYASSYCGDSFLQLTQHLHLGGFMHCCNWRAFI